MSRRFPPPWTVEQIPGGYKVKDANGQSLAYAYGRESPEAAARNRAGSEPIRYRGRKIGVNTIEMSNAIAIGKPAQTKNTGRGSICALGQSP